MMRHIALVPDTAGLDVAELCRVAAALQKQVVLHLAQVSNAASATVHAFAHAYDVPQGYGRIIVCTGDLQPGQAGRLERDAQGDRLVRIPYSSSWSLAASCACLEMLAEAGAEISSRGTLPAQKSRVDAIPDVNRSYVIDGVTVADFKVPVFFGDLLRSCVERDSVPALVARAAVREPSPAAPAEPRAVSKDDDLGCFAEAMTSAEFSAAQEREMRPRDDDDRAFVTALHKRTLELDHEEALEEDVEELAEAVTQPVDVVTKAGDVPTLRPPPPIPSVAPVSRATEAQEAERRRETRLWVAALVGLVALAAWGWFDRVTPEQTPTSALPSPQGDTHAASRTESEATPTAVDAPGLSPAATPEVQPVNAPSMRAPDSPQQELGDTSAVAARPVHATSSHHERRERARTQEAGTEPPAEEALAPPPPSREREVSVEPVREANPAVVAAPSLDDLIEQRR